MLAGDQHPAASEPDRAGERGGRQGPGLEAGHPHHGDRPERALRRSPTGHGCPAPPQRTGSNGGASDPTRPAIPGPRERRAILWKSIHDAGSRRRTRPSGERIDSTSRTEREGESEGSCDSVWHHPQSSIRFLRAPRVIPAQPANQPRRPSRRKAKVRPDDPAKLFLPPDRRRLPRSRCIGRASSPPIAPPCAGKAAVRLAPRSLPLTPSCGRPRRPSSLPGGLAPRASSRPARPAVSSTSPSISRSCPMRSTSRSSRDPCRFPLWYSFP